MKHILVLTQTYEPFKDGVAEAAKITAVGLAQRGYQVTVGTGYHPDRHPDPPGANPCVKQFEVSGAASWRIGICGDVAGYQEFIAGFRGEFVICHSWQAWSTDLALPLFRSMTAKKIIVSHGFSAHMVHWRRRFPWGVGQWLGWLPYMLRLPCLLKKFWRVVFLSKRIDWHRFFDHWIARLIGHPGIVVIPNSVDPSAFEKPLPDFRAAFGVTGGLLFLCVANYCTRKNQELTVRAFRKARLVGATLVFIGSEFNEYQAFVRDLDKELAFSHPEGHVVFLERISRDLTLAAFKACDVFVLTAKEETQPFVLIEAMACGKPFISTESSGCIAELAGGCAVSSEEEMVEKMKYLSNHPDMREALGHAGRETFLAQYTREHAVNAFEKLLR